ncbi:MAG: anti-sigma factor [Acidobacteriota bacterium]
MSSAAERIMDLQAERFTSGLGIAARAELDALIAEHGSRGSEALELAAAATDIACFDEIEPLPASLRAQIETQGSAWIRGNGTAGVLEFRRAGEDRSGLPSPIANDAGQPETSQSQEARGPWLPWLLAAAALVAAVLGWARPGVGPVDVEPVRLASLDEKRDLLLAADDVVTLEWTATDDEAAAGVRGDVVWSTARQRGFMRFQGLPVNDPGELQYQLWIFDATRDDRYPIDGGVFDIREAELSADGAILVPIRATLPVREPALFAVTVEPPGGVMVSSRERIVTLAQVG